MKPQPVPPTLTPATVAPLLLLLFFGSGCAALICELVWLHVLQLVIGSSAISLAVLLASFMGSQRAQQTLMLLSCGAAALLMLPPAWRAARAGARAPFAAYIIARRVVVIGCGAGVTAGAVSLDPVVAEETIVEIEPLVPRSVAEHFAAHNEHVLTNPKVRVRIDDARHHLLTTRDTYDAITSDPLDPWVKGAAALYTVEFLRTVRARLAPGGVFTMFVQLYESSEAAVKSEVATFFEVFPHGLVFANTVAGRGYDLVLLGQAEPTRIDLDALEDRLARTDMEPVARSLRQVGVGSGVELCGTFVGQAEDLRTWLRGAELNRDADLRLQYLAGLGLNEYRSAEIYAAMMDHPFRFPPDVFRGSERRLQQLRETLRRARGE